MNARIYLVLLSAMACQATFAAGSTCTITKTAIAPDYPSGPSFSTSELINMASSTETVTLRYTPNYPPSGYTAKADCPYEQVDLLAWEDPNTWGGAVPGDGEDVTLPENSNVLLGGCSVSSDVVFGKITIPESSSLVFADEDIMFNLTGMLVHGHLSIGSETCRLHSKITVTLHGIRPSSAASVWYKGIVAVGKGVLDVHGSIFHPTWTRLAKKASAGDSQIYLQHRVNWQAGQTVVLTGTEIKDSRDWHRNEQRKIENVEISGEFSRITLTEPVDYTHYSGSEYQGEVGLLSRNIIIQGDETSEPTDTANTICEHSSFGTYPCEHTYLTGFGGHTMSIGSAATARFEGVELYRMGQTNVMARYPFHLHLMEAGGKGSYLKHSSIHHSFYRCATIHGTNHSLIQDNVAFDAIGHCFYSGEDGVEENNTVSYNLASHVHFMEFPRTASAQYMADVYSSDKLTQPADVTASGFYITNAYNRYYGNAASGGYAGFAIVKMPTAIMHYRSLKFDPGLSPHQRPFLEFDGNTCHSTGIWWSMGGCIYVGGKLTQPDEDSDTLVYNPGREVSGRDTKCLTKPKSSNPSNRYSDCPLEFNNTKVFLANYGINNWGSRGTIRNYEAHDVIRPVAILGQHYVTNLLGVCRTKTFTPERPGTHYYEKRWFNTHMFWEWYDTYQAHILDGVTARNCGDAATNSPVWRFLTHSDRYVPGFLQATRNVKYENIDRSMLIQPSVSSFLSVSGWLSNWLDADGSVHGAEDGSSGPKIIGAARDGIEWWHTDDSCFKENDFYVCNQISATTGNRRGIASFSVVHDPQWPPLVTSGAVCSNGNKNIECPKLGRVVHLGYHAQRGLSEDSGLPLSANTVVTGPVNGFGWLFLFDSGSPVEATFKLAQIDEDDNVILVFPYPAGTTFDIKYVAASWCGTSWAECEHPFTAVSSVAALLAGNGDNYFFDSESGLLYFRFLQQVMGSLDFSETPGYGKLGTTYFVNSGLRIPPVMWGGTLVLKASGCTKNSTNSNYCEKSSYDLTSVCENYGYAAGTEPVAFDSCSANAEFVITEGTYIVPTKLNKLTTITGVASSTDCQQECADKEGCGAFTYYGRRKKCILLKEGDYEFVVKSTWSSGLLSSTGKSSSIQYCQNKRTRYSGTTVSILPKIKNWKLCQEACLDREACLFWNYKLKGSGKMNCELLADSDGEAQKDSAYTSSPRLCVE